ncbi:MAG: hypothetical protein Q4B54_11595 [Coriobacteriales bacterium]|nr:hypothetical protein [Coriobacteriales bacterium]
MSFALTDVLTKSRACLAFALLVLVASLVAPAQAWADAASGSASTQAMFRLYNPNSGEHFYTASRSERYAVIDAGWIYEGVGWMAPVQSSTPVYRLYNPNGHDHHYTASAGERDALVDLGWNYEGIGWYSDDAQGVAVLRAYNPNAESASHNYTASAGEQGALVAHGWNDEGVGWYAADEPLDVPTVKEFLSHALEPIGSTLYVYGGAWNEADDGPGVEARTLGLSPRWAEFAAQHDSSYDYSKYLYWIHDGLDCSGFVGWSIYQTMETESFANPGYVMSACDMARTYADYGWGSYTPVGQVSDWRAGDIMSMENHVWIALGTCADGSVLFVHSSPPCVTLSGTLNADGSESDSVRLAREYMWAHYPEMQARYNNCSRGHHYLTVADQFRWNRGTLADPEGLTNMSGEEVIAALFA